MIDLEKVNVNSLELSTCPKKIQEAVKYMDCTTMEEFLFHFDEYGELDLSAIRDRIDSIKGIVRKSNEEGKEPIIYPIKSEKRYKDVLGNYQDSLIKGDVLLLESPTIDQSVRYSDIHNMTIEEIVRRLLTVTPDGNNYLKESSKKLGKAKIKRIVDAINLYHEQMDRLSRFVPRSTAITMFEYQREEKRALVEEKYKAIVLRLILNTNEFVWGKLTRQEKEQLLSSINNYGYLDRFTKDRLIKNVADYTTLKELKRIEKNDYKVLQRFIKN